MNSPGLTRSLLVLAGFLAAAATVEGGLFRRHVVPSGTPCPCPEPTAGPYNRQTVARLTTRVVTLRDYINSRPDAEIAPAVKAELNRQIDEIGRPGQRPPKTVLPFRDDSEFVGLLPPDQVQTVGGEIGQIRQSLRTLENLPQD